MSISEFEFESNAGSPAIPATSSELPKTENRSSGRTLTDLKTIVHVEESADESWKEITNVTSVSRNGAGFGVKKPCYVGRLVKLVMPLPPELRAYDLDNELYPVVGVVQYCRETSVDNELVYQVGVGFIGKSLPESYKNDPTQSYAIIGMAADGLWRVTESGSPFKPRRSSRFWMQIPMTISLLQGKGKEDAFTENLSTTGAAVACSLDAQPGDRVKVACKEYDFYAVAIVRNRKESADKSDRPGTLHIEFVETHFPIEKVHFDSPANGE